jgi:hypothetical protein
VLLKRGYCACGDGGSREKKKKVTAAREVEEKAMLMLGYRKAWTACGQGSFLWMKLPSKTS